MMSFLPRTLEIQSSLGREARYGHVILCRCHIEHVFTVPQSIRLGLNCVGGRVTTSMTRLLGHDAHLVSYGAMSKEPLSLSTALFIFKNLTCHGFWQTRWYADKTLQERKRLTEALFGLMREGKVRVGPVRGTSLPKLRAIAAKPRTRGGGHQGDGDRRTGSR